ncbi:hypothetical protein C457_00685 [Haloferax prahovense DSM 18310]|uniref:Uncharacterized protein n=1 Tax=Haloferax prahovense (strain DSM 18310 / JCM 13924 / TL6) TaxID=1227461 RepID=M0GNE3_HALPT|nr:hypothetical protein C457_00685 [Haloferax prahovense DSM 18310]
MGALAREVLAEAEAVHVDADRLVPLLGDAEEVAEPRVADDAVFDGLADGRLDVVAVVGLLLGRGVQKHLHVLDRREVGLVALGVDEVLQFGLRELAGADDALPRRNLVAVGAADLRHAEREAIARVLLDARELHEDALRRLGAEVAGRRGAGSDVRLEHEVEVLDRLAGEVRAAGRTDEAEVGDFLRRLLGRQCLRVLQFGVVLDEVVRAVGLAALGALDEHVVEAVEVARRLEDGLGHDGRRFDFEVALLDGEALAPRLFDVGLQGRALRAVGVEPADAAVGLRGAEEKAASLGEFGERCGLVALTHTAPPAG